MVGGLIVFFLIRAGNETVPVAVQPAPDPEPLARTEPAKAASKPVAEKPKPPATEPKSKPARHNNEFVIQGLLSTGGEPWAADMLRVKVLWLKNKNDQQFLIGRETGLVQATPDGLVYRIILRRQSQEFINWNGGVEGNVGRIIAFVDHQRDGRLTPKKDKILAVSKELIRYRTGRYDKTILNEVQQQNIRQAGRGYVLVRHEEVSDNKLDWKVIARNSPARLDLNATETGLPGMYNTFMKLQ